jgi:hypothetical protein
MGIAEIKLFLLIKLLPSEGGGGETFDSIMDRTEAFFSLLKS